MSPQRYAHEDWPWWHRAITDLRLYLIIVAALSLYSIVIGQSARHNAQQSINTLVSCTTPKHECYDRGQQQQGKAIAAIQQSIVYANYCAVHAAQHQQMVTVKAIEKCVADLLSKDAKGATG